MEAAEKHAANVHAKAAKPRPGYGYTLARPGQPWQEAQSLHHPPPLAAGDRSKCIGTTTGHPVLCDIDLPSSMIHISRNTMLDVICPEQAAGGLESSMN